MRTVLVCGGRDYYDRDSLFGMLDRLHAEEPIGLIVNGGAAGADGLSSAWAMKRGVALVEIGIEFGKSLEKAALAPIRKELVLATRPGLLVAFPGDEGTASIVRIAREAGVTVLEAR